MYTNIYVYKYVCVRANMYIHIRIHADLSRRTPRTVRGGRSEQRPEAFEAQENTQHVFEPRPAESSLNPLARQPR